MAAMAGAVAILGRAPLAVSTSGVSKGQPLPFSGNFASWNGIHVSSSSPVSSLRISGRQGVVLQKRGRGQNLVVRGLFGLGVPELAVIAGVAVILFGPKKLPEIGKSLGKTLKSFQQAAKEFEAEVKNAPGSLSVESNATEPAKTETPVAPNSVSTPAPPTSTATISDKESA